jgi:hypothetical protein
MANELTLSGLRVQFTKSNVPSVDFNAPSLSVTVTANVNMDNVQTVGFAGEEAILMGDCAAGGYCYIQNMDATNFVSLRAATGETDLIKLLAGEWCLFRLHAGATAPFAIADTGNCNVRILRFGL